MKMVSRYVEGRKTPAKAGARVILVSLLLVAVASFASVMLPQVGATSVEPVRQAASGCMDDASSGSCMEGGSSNGAEAREIHDSPQNRGVPLEAVAFSLASAIADDEDGSQSFLVSAAGTSDDNPYDTSDEKPAQLLGGEQNSFLATHDYRRKHMGSINRYLGNRAPNYVIGAASASAAYSKDILAKKGLPRDVLSTDNLLTAKLADYFMKLVNQESAYKLKGNSNSNEYKSMHECPPCFNCNLDMFRCLNDAECSKNDGRCTCPPGFGGARCEQPLCDSPLEGDDRRLRGDDEASCSCTNDYTGINCNICTTDASCSHISNDPNDPGTCFSTVAPIMKNNLQCKVTNKAILQQLNGKIADITYSCDSQSETCAFQFWIGEVESFYCALQECKSEVSYSSSLNKTQITCDTMKCGCYPGRPLCDPNGMDLSEWFASDDPEEGGPSGPGSLYCEETPSSSGELPTRSCKFEEPHMNTLISTVFGDDSIFLVCPLSGECLPRSQVPRIGGGGNDDNNGGNDGDSDGNAGQGSYSTLTIVIMSLIAVLTLVGVIGGLIIASKSNKGAINLDNLPEGLDDPNNEEYSSLSNVLTNKCSLIFHNISYTITKNTNKFISTVKIGGSGRTRNKSGSTNMKVLTGVSGFVEGGQVLAIMGGSGAGKSTLLDILANRNKSGHIKGDLFVNSKTITGAEYRKIIGFVDQEDTLMETLTVFETIYFSASLRLPNSMSDDAKRAKVYETMEDLGIMHIANRRIGGSIVGRGISGGEKRRVSIACELVTSPSIIFLDEPTSGLDSYSAYNIVRTLSQLAKRTGRTIVLTIHQPRSNIYSLFDSLILLARGHVVYSGLAHEYCYEYFSSIGYTCPKGFNIADYLVDVSMGPDALFDDDESTDKTLIENASEESSGGVATVRNGSSGSHTRTIDLPIDTAHYASIDSPSTGRTGSNNSSSHPNKARGKLSRSMMRQLHIEKLKNNYLDSTMYKGIEEKYRGCLENQSADDNSNVADANPVSEESNLGTHRIFEDPTLGFTEQIRASTANLSSIPWLANPYYSTSVNGNMDNLLAGNVDNISKWKQFKILSGRTFKNIYRHPSLIRAHYGVAIAMSLICGFFFYKVDNSLSGFQNRMGAFFFICSVFGFGCLSSMQVFSTERHLFKRERANGYYSPTPYFISKVIFDLIPLRVIPPILFSLITYHLIGLREDSIWFFVKFVVVLVLYNVTAACCCLAISIIFSDYGVSVLVATLVMLFEMLFGGMLINHAMMSRYTKWIVSLSFFNAAWEALLVNEVLGLQLIEKKFNLSIKVPGALILETFGLNSRGYNKDIVRLALMSSGILILGYVWLRVYVKEQK